MSARTRRSPGVGAPGSGQIIELDGIDKAHTTGPLHDAGRCATCLGFQPWTPERRELALTYAATSGRRIIDLSPSRFGHWDHDLDDVVNGWPLLDEVDEGREVVER